MKNLAYLFIASIVFIACGSEKNNSNIQSGIKKVLWGQKDNKQVDLYTLTNKNGIEVKISNYGGTVTAWIVPDKNGNNANILLGFDSLSGYMTPPPYFGALIGRYGNRIANGKFTIDIKQYQLATNNGKNHLHGGLKGFDKVVWDAVVVSEEFAESVWERMTN